jgi:hypothetical protein
LTQYKYSQDVISLSIQIIARETKSCLSINANRQFSDDEVNQEVPPNYTAKVTVQNARRKTEPSWKISKKKQFYIVRLLTQYKYSQDVISLSIQIIARETNSFLCITWCSSRI